MATETVAEGYVYLHDGSHSAGTITYTTYCIKIRLTKIERDIQRSPKLLQIPQSVMGSTPDTQAVDLNVAKHNLTITGYLSDVVSVSSTATSGGNNTLSDSTKNWTTDEWADYRVKIVSGTGVGQWKRIISNTSNQLTVDSNWTTNPDGTSVYNIIKTTYIQRDNLVAFGKTGADVSKSVVWGTSSGRGVQEEDGLITKLNVVENAKEGIQKIPVTIAFTQATQKYVPS